MKTLFIILKATTGVTLISPTVLSVMQDFQKYGDQNSSETIDRVVNTSTTNSNSPLNTVLEGHTGMTQDENFSNFTNNKMSKEKYPDVKTTKGKWVPNDDNNAVNTGSDPSDGLADDRFGGGLFFDIGGGKNGFNKQTQQKINSVYKNGSFGDGNSVSIDHVMSPDTAKYNLNEASTISQKTLDANNQKGDIYPPNHRENFYSDDTSRFYPGQGGGHYDSYTEAGKDIDQNFTKAINPKPDSNLHPIVKASDFNLTPDNISTATGSQTSKTKAAMKTLFNEELYDWYWTTWNREYSDPSIANANYATANDQQKALDDSGLAEDIKLALNLSWNQLIDEGKKESPWYTSLPKDVAIGALGTALDAVIPGLGAIGTAFIDALFPEPGIEIYKDIKNYYDYYSAALGYSFWTKFFDQYLGTPNGDTGLINDYYKEHGKIPTDITMKNFDVYTPFSDINISSEHSWYNTTGTPGFPPPKSNASSSKFDLSKLVLDLGAEFNLTRNDPSVDKLINELKTYTTNKSPLELPISEFITDPAGKYKNKYYVDDSDAYQNIHRHNEINIKNYLDDHGFSLFDQQIPGLTFKGELFPNQASPLEVYYNGKDQGFPIYVKIS